MRFQIGIKLFSLRLCRRSTSGSDDIPVMHDRTRITQTLPVLIQMLTIAEKAAGVTTIPGLKGAIGTVLSIMECVQGYNTNNESLHKLALSCGHLMIDITNRLRSGTHISASLERLVEDLLQTLERCQKLTQDMSSTSKTMRFLTQKDKQDKIDELRGDVRDAQSKFQTLALLDLSTKIQSEAIQDRVYTFDSITLGASFATGDEWVAFTATELDSGSAILVKRYVSNDQSIRKMMHAYDLKAFKKNWYPHCIQYMGGSDLREDYPFIVLRGVMSDHVSDYIALKFREDNQRGSLEALRLLKDLTNALAHTVRNTDSATFDISKVHLNDSGRIVVVDLEPCLQAIMKSKNNMPYWRSWQEICIEVGSVLIVFC
ncbi:hypothetical protein PILCRDRAFT_195871 [Piloderma croceum F 1598]|uniref:Uncharacterized protein n=1 Tax=Piloderma croceum (strain F 1598) TaxID=765440 RepID=A0A0C3G0P2_PILCF|nr:hypothetical protein PILCRDRAFT_195871 [Piloderma croceum F 1598]